jgi:hypothetical protein
LSSTGWLSRCPRGPLPAVAKVAEVALPPDFAGSAAALALGDELLGLKLPYDDR